jgi:hypothetical protein
MISQMVRIESVRFGRHIDIEVNYKILQLEVPKLVPILHYPACFQKGLFGGTKIGSNFALSGLFSKGAVWRQFCQKAPSSL